MHVGQQIKIKDYHPDWNGKEAIIIHIDGSDVIVQPIGYCLQEIDLLDCEIEE